MSKPIAIFYHCLTHRGDPPEVLPVALSIIHEQMMALNWSGLTQTCSKMIVGINGGEESSDFSSALIPEKATVILHGLQSMAENLTIIEIEKWVKDHHDWHVLYLHCKGATHGDGDQYTSRVGRWRRCMMSVCIGRWKECVQALDSGFDAVGAHWMKNRGSDRSQHYFAGNFFWATSNFLRTLPSMYERERIKISGIAAAESRYESEVWLGNGRMPKVKDLASDHRFLDCV